MSRNLDTILVVDLECTCWKDRDPPEGQKQEIIEIGVAVMSAKSRAIIDADSIMVKPVASTVSNFCTSLTTITPEMAAKGLSFRHACNVILRQDFDSRNVTWASWGDFDRRMFQRQCGDPVWDNTPYPFGPTHLNVKNLFALKHKLPSEMGMKEALQMINLPLEGTHHRGVDDAKNIATILATLL